MATPKLKKPPPAAGAAGLKKPPPAGGIAPGDDVPLRPGKEDLVKYGQKGLKRGIPKDMQLRNQAQQGPAPAPVPGGVDEKGNPIPGAPVPGGVDEKGNPIPAIPAPGFDEKGNPIPPGAPKVVLDENGFPVGNPSGGVSGNAANPNLGVGDIFSAYSATFSGATQTPEQLASRAKMEAQYAKMQEAAGKYGGDYARQPAAILKFNDRWAGMTDAQKAKLGGKDYAQGERESIRRFADSKNAMWNMLDNATFGGQGVTTDPEKLAKLERFIKIVGTKNAEGWFDPSDAKDVKLAQMLGLPFANKLLTKFGTQKVADEMAENPERYYSQNIDTISPLAFLEPKQQSQANALLGAAYDSTKPANIQLFKAQFEGLTPQQKKTWAQKIQKDLLLKDSVDTVAEVRAAYLKTLNIDNQEASEELKDAKANYDGSWKAWKNIQELSAQTGQGVDRSFPTPPVPAMTAQDRQRGGEGRDDRGKTGRGEDTGQGTTNPAYDSVSTMIYQPAFADAGFTEREIQADYL